MAWIEDLIREAEMQVDEVEVVVFEGESIATDLKRKKISLATSMRDCGLGIRTIHHGRIGSSATNNPADWRACLQAAVASGNLATPQEWSGLPDRNDLPGTPLTLDPALVPDPSTARDLLARMLEGASRYDADVTAGSAGLARSRITLANSHGVRYSSEHTGVSVSLEAIQGQSTGYEYDHSWKLDGIDPVKVGEQAAFFASQSAKGKEIPTGDYDLVLSPLAYAEILGSVFVPALSGKSVNAGRSKLAGLLGSAVAAEGVSMYDDPLRPGANGSTYWDAEGVPARRVDFVKNGILSAFAYDLRTAYRYGKVTTGNAVRGGYGGLPSIGHHNFVIDGRRDTVDDERALYVHSVVGAHTANPMSGEFSVELSNAFIISNGEFQEPVRSAMLTGNAFDLQHAVSGLGRDTRSVGSLILPSVRINKQRIIGK